MKKIIIIVIGIIVIGIAYYGLSPLFRNVELDEALPKNITGEKLSDEGAQLIPSGFDGLSPTKQEEMLKLMEEANKEEPTVANNSMPEDSPVESATEDVSEYSPVMGTLGHPANGRVRVLATASGTMIRYEDFSTINGPRLHVYLAKDLEAKEYIDLGAIKGTRGNINYEVPTEVDVSEYKYVMYWCVPFNVLFNYAEI